VVFTISGREKVLFEFGSAVNEFSGIVLSGEGLASSLTPWVPIRGGKKEVGHGRYLPMPQLLDTHRPRVHKPLNYRSFYDSENLITL
jgi:hypothetical protein